MISINDSINGYMNFEVSLIQDPLLLLIMCMGVHLVYKFEHKIGSSATIRITITGQLIITKCRGIIDEVENVEFAVDLSNDCPIP